MKHSLRFLPFVALLLVTLVPNLPGQSRRPIAAENGKFLRIDGRDMLYGGKSPAQHFDISNSELKKRQYHYGMGREAFHALLDPRYIDVATADSEWPDDARFLVAFVDGEAKAYSVKDLTRHEIVNDTIGGHPIMAAYCILADLGAVYDRAYGDTTLTFGVSGYTYFDSKIWDGLDGFLIWDRDTESLWWPLIDRAVSGPLKGTALRKFDEAHWTDTTWADIKARFPHAQVLQSNQDFKRPNSWPRLRNPTSIQRNFKQR